MKMNKKTEDVERFDLIEVMGKFHYVTSIESRGIHPTVGVECFTFGFENRLSITAFIGEIWLVCL